MLSSHKFSVLKKTQTFFQSHKITFFFLRSSKINLQYFETGIVDIIAFFASRQRIEFLPKDSILATVDNHTITSKKWRNCKLNERNLKKKLHFFLADYTQTGRGYSHKKKAYFRPLFQIQFVTRQIDFVR